MTRPMRIRWTIIGLLMGVMILNYLSRSILGVAAPTIMREQDISTQQYGWITAAFQVGIMFQPLVGWLLDAIGLKIGFAIFAGLWSVVTLLHGFASGWVGFAALRGLLGLAEGAGHPGSMKVVSEWFPARERGFAGGLYNIGASLGAVFAPPLVAWAILTHSWRAAFLVAGGISLAWVLLWLFWYSPPASHRAVSAEEKAEIEDGQETGLEAMAAKPSVGSLLRQRNLWGIALPRMLADPTWGTLSFWMPLYLMTARHFDIKQMALFAWLPFLGADLGCLFGPSVVAFLQRRGIHLIDARRYAFTLGAVLMTGVAAVGWVTDPVMAIALLCLGGFAHQTLSVTVITMSADLFRKNEVGTVAGLAGLAGNTGLLIFSLLIGTFVDQVGYEPFFVVLACLDLLGAALLWTLVRKPS
ncbi:MFS transporter [Sphingomonas sp.]|uniref:MFS transporter n=1 Tax=Sphingomonas sp. TaxID=28214 RepID=UPI000DB01172|nr:MFS transporter [Sphingomonas sp.]PZU08788.1 MAG: MFS transporter [Sphingomonas sp.]